MKNTTMIILTALILACNVSAPGEDDNCEEQLVIADEDKWKAQDRAEDCEEKFLMGDGQPVDLEPIHDVVESGFVSEQYTAEYVQSLVLQLDEQYRINRVQKEQLEGVQEEYRSCNMDRAHIVTQYFAVLDGAATVPCVIDGQDAFCEGVD